MTRSFVLSIAGRVFLALILAFSAGASGDALLDMVPANSVVCIRVNNLDYALGMMDQYLAGATPAPMGITMMARGGLAGILNDATLENVNTGGNFAVFGLFENSEAEGMKGGFYGLIPMKDYAKFVSDNTNCGDADGKGVSQIKGVQNMGQEPMVLSLIKRIGDYALLASAANYDGLVSTADTMKAGKGLGGDIGAEDTQKALKSPFWIHADVAQVSKLFGPLVFGKIDEIKAELDAEKGAPPGAVMDIYVGIIKVMFEELASVNIALTPRADVMNALIAVNAVPGSDAYKSFQGGGVGGTNKLLNYVEDDSMINMAARMDTPFWQQGYVDMMDMIGTLGGDAVSAEDIEKLKAAAKKSIGATGAMVFTMSMGEKDGEPTMTIKEVVEVKDEKAYAEATEEMLALMNDGAISDLYKGFGIKMSCSEATDAGTYKGVKIKSAKLGLESTEPGEAFGQMIDGIYGGGFDYRWAIFDNTCVYAIGEEVDAGVRELIDSVKAGGPKSTCAEMQEAMRHLNTSDVADFIGTYNYVRLISMMGPMMASMAPAEPGAPDIGKLLSGIDVDSTSNIAFAGSASGGTFAMEIALPKAHLMEMMQVFGTIQQRAMEIQQQEQQQHQQ